MILRLLSLFITSQLIQHTCSEWVEISQQHYRRKPEDFFETATRKPAVTKDFFETATRKPALTKADVSAPIIKAPVLEIGEEDSARIKGAVLSVSNGVSDNRPKKGNVYKITNVGVADKGHRDVTFKDSDELNFSSEDKKAASVSDFRKGEIDKTSVVHVRNPPKGVNGRRKSNPVLNNRFGSKGILSPVGNKIVRLTNNKNSQSNNVQTSQKVDFKNGENVKLLDSANNHDRKPTHDHSGQRYESYEIKDDENNKYILKPKGAQVISASDIKTKDKIVLHNLENVVPQLTTQRPLTPTTVSPEDVFNVQTVEYPYIDVIHDFDEIPNRRVDLIDSDSYTLEADEISDVKLIVRKPAPKNKQENPRIGNNKQAHSTTGFNNDKTFSKTQYHVYSNEKTDTINDDQQTSSEIKNDKIPFERLDVTKIAEPPDPGFVTKHDIIEEGFIIDDYRSGNSGQESSEDINESETFTDDDVTVTTEKTEYESVQDGGTSINSTKLNPIENVIKVVKYVAETISKNTRKGFKSKINYLNKLKSSLMNNIVSKIEAIWPDDDARSHRTARQARSHVEFPSSEGALMSISFLTFAVFLIKLVMQLIQTFKNNNPQFVAPAGAVLVSRAASAISQRAGTARATGN